MYASYVMQGKVMLCPCLACIHTLLNTVRPDWKLQVNYIRDSVFATFEEDEVVGENFYLPISRALDFKVLLNAWVAVQHVPG